MRVLVVEDDFAVRETLGMVLEAFNHEPVLVENGEQALDRIRESWPDALLLDLTLEESTGEQVYEQIRQSFGKVPPTVVLSAVQHGEDRAQSMPGVLYLAKPYTIEDLAEILEEAVALQRGAA
jgi:CheY-like chemotaxis protein